MGCRVFFLNLRYWRMLSHYIQAYRNVSLKTCFSSFDILLCSNLDRNPLANIVWREVTIRWTLCSGSSSIVSLLLQKVCLSFEAQYNSPYNCVHGCFRHYLCTLSVKFTTVKSWRIVRFPFETPASFVSVDFLFMDWFTFGRTFHP